MIYSWTFKNLRVIAAQGTLADVAVSVDYRLAGTSDKTAWSYAYGTVDFGPANPDAFIEFSAITKDDMVAFVEQALGDSKLNEIKAELEQELLNPVEVKELPWEPKAESIE